jgi:hypothetical protein
MQPRTGPRILGYPPFVHFASADTRGSPFVSHVAQPMQIAIAAVSSLE